MPRATPNPRKLRSVTPADKGGVIDFAKRSIVRELEKRAEAAHAKSWPKENVFAPYTRPSKGQSWRSFVRDAIGLSARGWDAPNRAAHAARVKLQQAAHALLTAGVADAFTDGDGVIARLAEPIEWEPRWVWRENTTLDEQIRRRVIVTYGTACDGPFWRTKSVHFARACDRDLALLAALAGHLLDVDKSTEVKDQIAKLANTIGRARAREIAATVKTRTTRKQK